MRKTIFIDWDGTCVEHSGEVTDICGNFDAPVLPGVVDTFARWRREEAVVIITTARPESMRELTIRQIQCCGLWYDQLVMGIGRGRRYVINDTKPDLKEADGSDYQSAIGITLNRNEGLANLAEGILDV